MVSEAGDSITPYDEQDNNSSTSMEPGAMTRISDENVTPQIDQALLEENLPDISKDLVPVSNISESPGITEARQKEV